MSKKQGKVIAQGKAARLPKGKPPVVGQVTVARVTLRSQDMANWQAAINQARNELMPRRRALYELFDNLVLDAHLHAVLTKRTTNVTNKRLEWVQEGASEQLLNTIYEQIIDTPWMHDFLGHAMSVVPYGPTLIELIPENGLIARSEVVPRANVVPERGYIAKDALNPDQPLVYYREDPIYSTYLIEVGKPKDLGALVIALPYLLWKRDGFADFAQFAELFGMPFRTGTYNPYDEGTRDKLNKALSEMGGAGYAVIPEGAKVEFHSASSGSGSQGSVFKDLVELCNAELSKLFLGNTLTTEQGDKGARSLGEVHQGVEHDLAISDMRRIEHLLNWELRPRLAALGYPVQDGYFRFDLSVGLPLEKRIEVDTKLAQQVEIPESYWRDTYGIPAPTAAEKKEKETQEPPEKKKEEGDDDPDEDDRGTNTARLRRQLTALYKPHHGQGFQAVDGPGKGSDAIMEELARAIHDGRITDGWVDPKLMEWTTNELTKAVMGGIELDDEAPAQSVQVRDMMRRNVAVFSGFKSYHTLRAATDELMDADGQFRSWADFRDRVLAIDKEYNQNYLRAEYQHAVASAQMADRWQDIQQDKDIFPFLRYSTAGDDRVRPDHDALDGVVKPVDDPFWDTNYPPNGWGCRCDVEQVASDERAKPLPANYSDQRQGMFRSNVGKDGIVFPKSHPYYNAPRAIADQVEQYADRSSARNGTEQWQGVPVPAIPKGPATKPAGTPVRTMLDITVRGKDRAALDSILDVIDQVHGDGLLPVIQFNHLEASVFGEIINTAGPFRINVNFRDPHHRIHIIHEVGHWLDNTVLKYGMRGAWGSFNARNMPDHPMRPLYNAMYRSSAVKHLQAIADLKRKPKDMAGNSIDLLDEELREVNEYLLQPEEVFARAYTQYIVEKSNNASLMEDIVTWDRRRFNGDLRRHWDPQDFAPIRKAFDNLFKREGWLTI